MGISAKGFNQPGKGLKGLKSNPPAAMAKKYNGVVEDYVRGTAIDKNPYVDGVINLVISSNTTNINLKDYTIANSSWDGLSTTKIVLTIESGIVVYSTSTAAAIVVPSMPEGTEVTIVNNGTIIGKGGGGGRGATGRAGGGGGGEGYDGINLAYNTTIDNLGSIYGGGGGGGGGASSRSGSYGGGGGGGAAYGVGGVGPYDATDGLAAGLTTRGTSGNGNTGGANGGHGGSPGYAGNDGAGANSTVGWQSGGGGGQPGYAVRNTQYVTWVTSGTVLGR